MNALRTWVKACFENIVDPDKGAEVDELTALLNEGIVRRKKAFVLAEILGERQYKKRHLEQAQINLYQKLLARAWKDGRVEPTEKQALAWISKCLEMPDDLVQRLNLESARGRFAEALSQAMEDGEISESESATLDEIAGAAGLSIRRFMTEFFRSDGERFLQGVFAATVQDKRVSANTFERMFEMSSRLGLSRSEVLTAIQPQVERFVEHVLVDAKQDDLLTSDEENSLIFIIDKLSPPADTRHYVLSEIEVLRALGKIRSGSIPSITAPIGASLRAGELAHHHGRAMWEYLKLLKSGPSTTCFEGELIFTDSRLVFSSPLRSHAISYRKVVGHDLEHGTIVVQVQGKPTDRFTCAGSPRIPYAILSAAIAMANQTLRNQDESRRSRHIPREVRQRIWQRYSGQCADCRATTYLEFDHIVPVAKGGSNSENNVQLLCRNCNSRKSDLI